ARKLLLTALAALLALSLTPATAPAEDGVLDPSFGGDGRVLVDLPFASPTAMAIDSKGRIVVAALAVRPMSSWSQVIRLNPDGSLDQSFGQGGIVETDSLAGERFLSVAIDEADRIVLGGNVGGFMTRPDFAVTRLLEDGRRDMAFAGDGLFTFDEGGGAALALDGQGGILLAGGTRTEEGWVQMAVLRVTPAGFLDTDFGSGGIAVASSPGFAESAGRAIAVGPGDRVLVAGSTGYVRPWHFAIAGFDALGNPDPAFGGGTSIHFGVFPDEEAANGVVVDPQGRIVLAGDSREEFALAARLLPDGSMDPSFAGDGTLVLSLPGVAGLNGAAIDAAGRILLTGGLFEGMFGDMFLARLREDGSFDGSFGAGGLVREDFSGPYASGEDLAVDAAGRYLVMGRASGVEGTIALARYLNGAQPPPGPAQAPRCRGKQATIAGTAGPDRLRGTRGRDVVVALGGNDRIRAFAGRDLICAGAGRDLVRAGKGNDTVFGGPGADRIFGGPGKDRLRGGPGRDVER
ncbi:MAG TPA: hypothetical protein VF030_03015, partial [Solirubrobacterales bacterium]